MSTTTIDLRVVHSLEEGGIYRVKIDVIYASNIACEIFVFKTDCNTFSHVATPYDMENIPDITAEAAQLSGNNFYRQKEVTRDYDMVSTAEEYSLYTRGRVEYLAIEYPRALDDFVGSHDYTYTGIG